MDEAKSEILELNHYYPFGMRMAMHNSKKLANQYYLYNGKEKQEETGWLDYGARQLDVSLGRWMCMDPLAEEYYSQSLYHFSGNNPIRFIDDNGMNYGDYYSQDGYWMYNDGIDDDKAYVVSSSGSFQGQVNVTELSVSNSELLQLASVSYGESSTVNNSTEMAAISNTIINNMNARGNGATISSTIDGFALAATDGNARVSEFNNATSSQKNGTSKQSALAGAINAVTGGQDYSNGATHWAGDDVGSSREKRATGGLLVTNPSHDIHSVGSKKINNAPITEHWVHNGRKTSVRGTYSYIWETTAGYGGKKSNGAITGTTFMKKTKSFLKATRAPRY
jgi:RHS repeat-associated protein